MEGGETIDVDRHFEDFVEIIKDSDDRRRRASNKDGGDDNQSVGGMSSQSQSSNRSNRDFWIQKEQQQINNNNNNDNVSGTSSVASGGSSNQQQQNHQHRRFRRGKKKPSKQNGDSLDRGSSHSASSSTGGSVYSSTSQGNYDNDDHDSYQKDLRDDDEDDDNVMDLGIANGITKIYTVNTESSSPRKSGGGTGSNYEPSFHDSFYDSMDFWADKDKRISGSKSPRTPGGGRRKFVINKNTNSFNGGGGDNNIGFMLSPTRTPGSGSRGKFVNKSNSFSATATAPPVTTDGDNNNDINDYNNNYQAKSSPNKSLSLSSSSKPPPLLSTPPGTTYRASEKQQEEAITDKSPQKEEPQQQQQQQQQQKQQQQQQDEMVKGVSNDSEGGVAISPPPLNQKEKPQQQQQQQQQDEIVKGVSDDSEGGGAISPPPLNQKEEPQQQQQQQQDEIVKGVSDDSEGGGAISPPPLNVPTNKQKKSPPPSSATAATTTSSSSSSSSDQQQQQQQQQDAGIDQKQQQQQDAGTVTTSTTIYSLTPPQTPEQQFEKKKIPGGGGGSSISSGSAATKTPKKSKSAAAVSSGGSSSSSSSATPKTPKSSTPKGKPKTPKSSSSTPKKSKSAGARSSSSNNTPKATPKRRKMKIKDNDIVDKEKDNKRSETSPITRSPRSRSKSKERGKRSTTPPRSPRSKSKERGKRSTPPPRSPRSKSKERGKRSTTPPRSPKMEKDKYSAAGEKSKSPKPEKKGKSRDVTPPRTRPKSPMVDKKSKLPAAAAAAVSKSPRKPNNDDNEFVVAAAAAKSPKSRKERKLGKKKNSKRNLLTDDTDSADENSKNTKTKRNKEGGEGGETTTTTTTTKKKKNKKQSSKRNLMADVDSLEDSVEAAAADTPKKLKKDKKDKKKDRQKKTPRKSNLQDGEEESEEAAAVVSANIHDLLSHMEKSTTLLVSRDEGDGDNGDYNASGNLSFGSVSFDSNPEKKKQNTTTTTEKEIDETTSDEIRAFKEKGGDGAYPVPLTETTPKQKGKRPGQKHGKKKKNVRKNESADDDDNTNEEAKQKHPPVRFKNVQGESLFSPKRTYKPPVFKKSVIEQEMIEKSFRKNPAFEGIVQSTQKRLIDAFEKIEVDKGATVAEEGGKEDKLFVVQQGEVSFHNRGIQIGTGEVGSTFGQMALKLPVQRDVEVKAERDHTVLFQLDHNNYREILRYETTREEEKRRELLRDVPFFKDATDSDLKQLGNAMKSHNFKKGENLTELYAESPFCLVVKGSLSIKDKEGTGGGGTEVGPGEVFGEEIFSSEDVKRVHIQALTDGRACTITREDFEKVFGDMGRIAGKARDKKILSEIKSIKAAKLSDADMDALVRQISNIKYESHENIFTIDEYITPALYLVRLGKVEIIKRNGSTETKLAGEYFGHYHVISAEEGGGGHHTVPSSVKAKYTAAPVGDTVCAVLTLQELATIVAGTAGQVPEELDQGTLIPLEDLVQHRILGEGQFGIVWLVTDRNDEDMEAYALKIQEVDDPNRPDSATAIRKEVETMKALHCPFIVKVFCTYETPESISMLMSVAPGGELFDLVHQEDEDGMWHSGLQEPHASFFATVIADVMAFMHHQRYLYRDLKPENVLIDQDGYPVITDFGFAKRMEGDADTKTYTFCGTPQYLCPEITLHHGHSYPADNWTIGVLIYELILGENPFFEPGVDSTILYDTICNKPPFFDKSDPISEEAKSLIFRLLEKDPNKRLGTFREKDILEDPWLSQYKVSKLRAKKIAAPWVPDPVEFEEI